MQVVILCGGKGTRLYPDTKEVPKALITIGDKPILWHLMKLYSQYGCKDFVLCLGHLGEKIKDYFQDPTNIEPGWKITFVDTGLETSKGERLKKVQPYIKDDNFFVSYGDDLSDVNIVEAFDFHVKKGSIATLTAVNPDSQFGIMEISDGGEISEFREKPRLNHWINGGFFVFNKKIFDYLKPGWDLERETFEKLAKERKICAFKHEGFWKCMNTFKDASELNEMWKSGVLKKILYKS